MAVLKPHAPPQRRGEHPDRALEPLLAVFHRGRHRVCSVRPDAEEPERQPRRGVRQGEGREGEHGADVEAAAVFVVVFAQRVGSERADEGKVAQGTAAFRHRGGESERQRP